MNKTKLHHCLRPLLRVDPIMVVLVVVLLATGLFFIYGTGQETGGRLGDYWVRQVCWVMLGWLCFAVVCCVDYRVLGRWSWLIYGVGIALLLCVEFWGVSVHHAQSWLRLPGLGMVVQPAEIAKPTTILFLAWLASRSLLRLHRFWLVVVVGLGMVVPLVLVLLQPDWGTALVFVPATLAILLVAGMPWKWFAVGLLVVALLAPILYTNLRPHQKNRINTFLAPYSNVGVMVVTSMVPQAVGEQWKNKVEVFFDASNSVADAGWNAHQSLLAVGSGGLWGKGFMKGTQHVLGFLPRTVAPTDFIFSVVAEEAGFMGAGAVVCAFAGLILCCLRTAILASDDFGRYLSVGIATFFFTHTYINIGMTIQAAPIIGIPLPFVSYGGSFMLSTMICAGLVQSVHVRRKN